jgi:hypothetical protein
MFGTVICIIIANTRVVRLIRMPVAMATVSRLYGGSCYRRDDFQMVAYDRADPGPLSSLQSCLFGSASREVTVQSCTHSVSHVWLRQWTCVLEKESSPISTASPNGSRRFLAFHAALTGPYCYTCFELSLKHISIVSEFINIFLAGIFLCCEAYFP